MTTSLRSTAVTKDYGKRTAIVTGSARGMYVLPSKVSSLRILNIKLTRIEAKLSHSDLRKMASMSASTTFPEIKLALTR